MFQFHNGTINTVVFARLLFLCRCFNSTTVQLILRAIARNVPFGMFQFHNGTINTSSSEYILFR